jgi:hypothetical protein
MSLSGSREQVLWWVQYRIREVALPALKLFYPDGFA